MSNGPIFDKLLIANRGEIACRVIKTCKRMGIKTVAVHSTADEQAKHVRMADEAVCVGPPASSQSYLRIDAILDACHKTKAQAVHPGYGFLSENADFSAALAKDGIVFIGPDAHSIDAMGDKIHSKKLAKEANVTTIPGFIGEITSHKQLLEVANEIGYPVMVKASGGGGGKGMRVAYNDKECLEFFELCKEEARASFNNDKMLVEKFIEKPRHIEIQVIADRKGNTLYLPERECSIQRRNQKVLEEAPSPFIDPKTRKEMGEQAAAMARKVDYVTAGTVEMVVDPKRNFYFLEMNTRLQVEHPITELITGVDLVEQMIRGAAGLELSIKQEDIKIHGWATEARVYAEDPMKNYFPSIGRLSQYKEPEGDGIRCDSGIVEGSQISVYYDPLICKLCTWGETRDQSLERMRTSLDKYVIRGLRHNVCLLRDVVTQPRYIKGELTTAYLVEEYPSGFKKAMISADQQNRLFAVAAIIDAMRQDNMMQIQSSMKQTAPGNGNCCPPVKYSVGYTETRGDTSKIVLSWNCEDCSISISSQDAPEKEIGRMKVHWNVEEPLIRVETLSGCGLSKPTEEWMQYYGSDDVSLQLQYCGSIFTLDALTAAQAAVINHMVPPKLGVSSHEVLSPMPGVIVGMSVKVGDSVVEGQVLLTLEAMKMRNKIRSEVDGVIKAINAKEGDTVGDGDVLIEFEHKEEKK